MNTTAQKRTDNGSLIAVCLAALMFGFEISSVPVSLSAIEKELHGSFKDLQWIMNAYTIACTTVLMAAGTLADKYGRKRIFIINTILFGITSLACGLAQDIYTLIGSRFLQGLSGGAMFICAIANLSSRFSHGKARARAFSVWGVIVGIGLGFGPVIGSSIMSFLSWRWIFLVHAPLALFTILPGVSFIRESKDPLAKRLDTAGMLLLAISVFTLTWYIIQGAGAGFTSIGIITVLSVFILSFILFIIVEKKVPHPMFDFSVFRISDFSGAIMGSIGMNFSFWPFIIYLPILLQAGFGYSVVSTGMCLLAYTLPSLIVPPLAEYLTLRYKARNVIPCGLLMIGAGFLLMRYGSMTTNASWRTILPGMLLSGIGLGMTNTPVTNTATGTVSQDRAGMASGIDTSARLITLALNIALMGSILVNGLLSQVKSIAPHIEPQQLYALAERIAAGDDTVTGVTGLSRSQTQVMLIKAFGNLLLFGGLGAMLLALCSFWLFHSKRKHGA
ncbi:MAG: MFS transporter [Chitinophagaceae bacterium]